MAIKTNLEKSQLLDEINIDTIFILTKRTISLVKSFAESDNGYGFGFRYKELIMLVDYNSQSMAISFIVYVDNIKVLETSDLFKAIQKYNTSR